MDFKVNIGNLEGKVNWASWKYKVLILLRTVPNGEAVIKGELIKPAELPPNSTDPQVSEYNKILETYINADTKAMLILTTNMTEETLTKVMRFTSAREIWLELHRLYEGVTEDKTFDLCMQFFTYKFNAEDDMANHLSKIKNIWNNLNIQLSEGVEVKNLPDILLICKILETLPNQYFAFKSSWLLMPKSERTVENLTSQLCAHERALSGATNHAKSSDSEEALAVSKGKYKSKFICHYCGKAGHVIPPKDKSLPASVNNMVLHATDSEVFSAACDEDNWFVDNGATNHVSNNKSLFKSIKAFNIPHKVTTANGSSVPAIGVGDIVVNTNGIQKQITFSNVWYVPEMSKNLFSVLSAQDKIPDSKFISTAERCHFQVNNKNILTGSRVRNGGLYKLHLSKVNQVCSISTNENILQLYHERFAHQNKRHVKGVIERELGIKITVDSEICEGCVYGKHHRLKFGKRERATVPGEIIHADVCGPFEASYSGFRYYVLFKDDFSRFRYIYFIKEKSEVYEKFLSMLKECERAGHKVVFSQRQRRRV